ncbi:MAG TPA: DUF559 domain-containing protein [Capillimicrobium sp.]|nr:DUF559 domain-containing protein [Capillimicrobium sp.]
MEAGQLLGEGISASAIRRHVERGALVRKYRTVFAVGHDALTPQGHWMAAVLAGGEGAVLSHRSAAAAWGLRPDRRSAIDITVRRRQGYRQPGLTPHRCRLGPEDVTVLDGIPITTVARTLLDLAEVVPFDHLLKAAVRADELELFDLHAITATLGRATGRRGAKPLRRVLAELAGGPDHTREALERRALRLVKRHGLPAPLRNALLHGYEVDLLWRRERLAVELDSWRHHHVRPVFESDRRRDVDLQAAGYRTARFTWRQVTREPDWVVARLRALLATAPPGSRS